MPHFQQLHVYRQAIDFVTYSVRVTSSVPRGYAHLADQLRRAAFSVPLNIGEGSGRISRADAARHYAIARGSAMECAAIIDVIHGLGVIDDEARGSAIRQLDAIVAMLTRLCTRVVPLKPRDS